MQVRTPSDNWDNRAECAVPYWSKENIWEAAGEGILQSRDLTPDFKPDLKDTMGKTRFGMQDAPYPRACKPNLRVPLGPRSRNGSRSGGGGSGGSGSSGSSDESLVVVAAAPHVDAVVSTLCAEVAKQEAEAAALNAKLAHMERELVLMRKILHGFIDLHVIYHDRGQI
jgi:hypothetical protein